MQSVVKIRSKIKGQMCDMDTEWKNKPTKCTWLCQSSTNLYSIKKKNLFIFGVFWNTKKSCNLYLKPNQTSHHFAKWSSVCPHVVSWEPEGRYYYNSKMFCWEPEGRYHNRLCTAIVPFWFSIEHLWMVIAPFCRSLNWRCMNYQPWNYIIIPIILGQERFLWLFFN